MKHKKTVSRGILTLLTAMVFLLAFTTFGVSATDIATSVNHETGIPNISVRMVGSFSNDTNTITTDMLAVEDDGGNPITSSSYSLNDSAVSLSGADYSFSIDYSGNTYTCIIPVRTVTYEAGGGGLVILSPPTAKTWQSLNVTLPDVATSHAFTGWYNLEVSGTKVGDAGADYTPTSNITLYAYYSDYYTAFFVDQDGTLYRTSSGGDGSNIPYPFTPMDTLTKTGYTLNGFYTAPTGGTVYDSSDTFSGSNVVYYAQWTPKTYYYWQPDSATYTISETNTSGGSPDTETFGSPVSLTVPTKDNYVFVGWVDDKTGVVYDTSVPYTIDGEATLTAKFAKDPDAYHTVSFIDQETNGVYESYYKFADETVAAPAEPTKTGYTFGGWSDGTTTISQGTTVYFTADKVYHAVWTPLKYTVTSPDAYTYTITQNDVGSSLYNQKITLDVPEKAGYLFIGWKDNNNDITYGNLGDTSVDYTITGATTLNAIFVKDDDAYRIIKFINKENGQVYDFVYQNYGDDHTVTAPAAPTLDGYTFAEWVNEADSSDTVAAGHDITISASTPNVVTYYADWTAKDYYYWMTGTGSDAEYHISLTDGSSGSAPSAHLGGEVELTPPTKTGYTFMGWVDDNDSTTYAYLGANVPYVINGETTLTPKFIEDVDYFKLVRFLDKDTGEVYGYYYRHVDQTGILAPAKPVKAGYDFVNWVNPVIPESGVVDDLNANDPIEFGLNTESGAKDYYAYWQGVAQSLTYSGVSGTSAYVESAFTSDSPVPQVFRTGDVVTFDCTGSATDSDNDNVVPQANYRIALLHVSYTDADGPHIVTLVPDENGICTFTMPVTTNNSVVYDAVAVQSVFNISDQTSANLSAAAYLEGSDISVDQAEEGDTVNVLFTPDSGYALKTDTIRILNTANGQELTYTKVTDGSKTYYQFTMPAGDVEIHADAKYDAYNISVSTTDATVNSLKNVDSGDLITDGVTPVPAGDKVSFGATANEGYTLSSVTVLDLSSNQYIPVVYDANNLVYSFTMPSADVKITVTAEKDKASLVMLGYDNTLLGIEVVEEGSSVAVNGNTITVGGKTYTAPTVDGYTFSQWIQTNNIDLPDQFNSSTAIRQYFIVKATYTANQYNISLAGDSSDKAFIAATSSISTNSDLSLNNAKAATDDSVQITVKPDANYQIKGVAVRDAAGNSTNVVDVDLISYDENTGVYVYGFTMPAYAVEVAAYTEAIPYHLTVNELTFPEGGTYTIDGNTTTNADIKQGEQTVIAIDPEPGYSIKHIAVYYQNGATRTYLYDDVYTNQLYDNASTSDINKMSPYNVTITMPAYDVTVDITYEKVNYSLSTKCEEDTWGSFAGLPATAKANVGDVIDFTVVANYGYNLKTLTILYGTGTLGITPIETKTPTVDVDGNTTYYYEFTMPASDVDIKATFVKDQYSVHFVQDVNDYTLLDAQSVDYLDKPSVPNIIPTKTGYHFTGWTKDTTTEDPGYGNPFVSDVFNTTQATTIYATYEVNNYGIDYVFNNAKGTVEGPANANYQAPVIVKVEPLTGYQINDVTATYLDANNVKQSITFTSTPTNMEDGGNYTFTMPVAKAGTNVTFTATFTEITRTVYLDEVDNATVTINKLAAEGDAEGVPAKYNSTVTIKITPDTGYQLTGLTVTKHGASDVVKDDFAINVTGGSYTFTMPAYDVDVNVTIEPIEYSVTWNGDAHSTIAPNPSGNIVGGYDYKEAVTFTVDPDTGYQIKSVKAYYLDENGLKQYISFSSDDPTDLTEPCTYAFTMPMNDVQVVVVTEPIIYNVNVAVVGDGAYRLNDNDQDVKSTTAAYGSTVKITPEPALGWEVSSVVANPAGDTINKDIGDGTYYTLHMMEASDVTVTITYIQSTYAISYNDPDNGTIKDDKDTMMEYQNEAGFTVDPDPGYQIKSVVGTYTDENDKQQTITFKSLPTDLTRPYTYTFTMPAAKVDIVVEFEKITYKVVTGPVIGQGEVRLNSTDTANITAKYDDEVVVTAAPADGWYLVSLTVTNDSISDPDSNQVPYDPSTLDETGGDYTFNMPASDVTVDVVFAQITYNITTNYIVDQGEVDVKDTAVENEKVSFTVTPEYGYEVSKVYYKAGDGAYHYLTADNDGNYNFTMPAKDIIITALFEKLTYQVTFVDYDNTTIGETQYIDYLDPATAPADPTRTGYTFTGWDPEDFTSVIEDMVITAQYKVNTPTVTVANTANGATSVDNDTPDYGSTVTVTADPADGFRFDSISVVTEGGAPVPTSFITEDADYVTTYTFSMPDDNVTVTVEYTEEASSDYTDVRTDDWFYDAVKFVTDRNYFEGVGGDLFAPNGNMTRAMFVTVLGRLYGVDTSAYTTSAFEDVDINTWYGPYVAWAAENNIVNGYGDTDMNGASEFGPNDNVTREQMAAIMYRYADFGSYDLSGKNESWMDKYSDSDLASAYAYDAIAWCVGNGIIHGYGISDTEWNIKPQGFATRAEVAQVIRNFVDKVIYK